VKKLFENWRKYLVLNERSDYEIFRKAGRNPYTGAKMNYNTAPITKEEAERNKEVMRQIVSIGDPTGVSSWPDVEAAWDDVNKEPTYANSGAFVFQFASAIPVIGKLPQWLGKGAKLLGIVDSLSDVSKAHRATNTAEGIAQADKIDNTLNTARTALKNMSLEGKNIIDVLKQHIVKNVAISAKAGMEIIEKYPSLKVVNTSVFRGMKVDASYIIKNYGEDIINKGPGVHVISVRKKFKPDSGRGTSSWSLDPDEADFWAGDLNPGARAKNKPFGISFTGGRGSVGVNISKAAEKLGHAARHNDWAEVAMIGDVMVDKVVIVNSQGLQKGQHIIRSTAMANKLKPGFYGAGSREEVFKMFNNNIDKG